MDEQLSTDWPRALNVIARSLNPQHQTIFRCSPMNYYWTAYQNRVSDRRLVPRSRESVRGLSSARSLRDGRFQKR
jgi:hypothetical protein